MLSLFRRRAAPARDVAAQVRAGFDAQSAGDLTTARACYETALADAPGNADANYFLGLLEVGAGRPDVALSRVERAIATDPSVGAFHFSHGELLRVLGRLGDAVGAFRQAAERDPADANHWTELGRTLDALGDRPAAVDAYRRAAETAPGLAVVWSNLALAELLAGRVTEAEAGYRCSLECESDHLPGLLGLAGIARRRGDLAQAEDLFRQVLGGDPDSAEALVNFSSLLLDVGRALEAEEMLRPRIEAGTTVPEAWINYGRALQELGRLPEALEALQRAVALAPASPVAHMHLGIGLELTGDVAAAERSLYEAVALDPANADVRFALGNILKASGALAEAESQYIEALANDSGMTAAWVNYGLLLNETGRSEQAVVALQKSVELDPGSAEAHLNLGLVQLHREQCGPAVDGFTRALELKPDLLEARVNLAAVHLQAGQLSEAERNCRRGLAVAPDHAGLLNNLAVVLQQQGRIEEAIGVERRLITLEPGKAAYWNNLLFSSNYSETVGATALFEDHVAFGLCFPPRRDGSSLRASRTGGDRRRIRIGYVSPDFRNHVVAYFFEPVLDHHDRKRFEVLCYYNERQVDATTRRLRASADLWRDIAAMDDDAVERLMLDDELDVMVDLAGHTANNRLAVLARRVAPVQVNWLGYPNTTGLPAMDWRITDARADPAPEADALHTERLYRMPEVFLNWRPHPDTPDVVPAPCLSAGHVTFCSFNNFAKISDHVLGLWARILAQLPDARLMMKTLSLTDASVQEGARRRLAQAGCDLSRVIFSPTVPSIAGHLGTYARADIALDTHPYNGTTTTCEALTMGVPVITLAGDRHAARVGVSLLECIGAGELVARSDQEYVDKAVALARDPQRIAAWRGSLRDRVLASPLADGTRFARDLEAAFLAMLDTPTD
jgi:predicted O-linked N-acetylglucosamine transferase (SPINDLY family)